MKNMADRQKFGKVVARRLRRLVSEIDQHIEKEKRKEYKTFFPVKNVRNDFFISLLHLVVFYISFQTNRSTVSVNKACILIFIRHAENKVFSLTYFGINDIFAGKFH